MILSNVSSTAPVSDVELEALVSNAQRQACVVAGFLDTVDEKLRADGCPLGTATLSPRALLALGAVCQLALWELDGLHQHLPAGLPSVSQAVSDLRTRAESGKWKSETPRAGDLWTKVLETWRTHFAWEAPNIVEAELVVSDMEDDALVDALAEFCWAYRHAPSKQAAKTS
jgi:hypothetical protein